MVESMALPTPESPDRSPGAAGPPELTDDEEIARRAGVENEMIRLDQAHRVLAQLRAAAAEPSRGGRSVITGPICLACGAPLKPGDPPWEAEQPPPGYAADVCPRWPDGHRVDVLLPDPEGQP